MSYRMQNSANSMQYVIYKPVPNLFLTMQLLQAFQIIETVLDFLLETDFLIYHKNLTYRFWI